MNSSSQSSQSTDDAAMATRRHTFPPATFTPVRRRRPLLRREASRRNIFEEKQQQPTAAAKSLAEADATQSSPALISTRDNSDDETVLHSNLVPLNDVNDNKNAASTRNNHNSFSSTEGSISDLSTLIAVEGERSKSKDMDDLSKTLDILEISFRTASKTNSRRRLSTSEVEMFLDARGADVAAPKRDKLSRSSRKNSKAARTA